MIETNANKLGLDSDSKSEDIVIIENKLRPVTFDDFIGQEDLKKNLDIAIKAALKRGEPLDHVLLHGVAGLGKTTLATVIANGLGVSLKLSSGPALEKPGDLAAILSNLTSGDVFFIDEIHRLKPVVEEILYTALEDFAIDIVLGTGPSARTVRLDLPHFTLIGATTKLNMISSPLRDRFGSVFRLERYSPNDLCKIIERSAEILGCKIDGEASKVLSKSSRGTPRIANRLLKRVRDFVQVHSGGDLIENEITKTALSELGLDDLGLDYADRRLLEVIAHKFNGGPVGLSTLAAALSEDLRTLEDIYEPFLIQLGFLERTNKGRIITARGFTHLENVSK
ncbi:Holliday junction branch migration DNA helicase RuvB [Patescibacteria group bacterium]|nr:Holliday junction branch migration DNA helicase RuvB [Patescibacteria group bacterium]